MTFYSNSPNCNFTFNFTNCHFSQNIKPEIKKEKFYDSNGDDDDVTYKKDNQIVRIERKNGTRVIHIKFKPGQTIRLTRSLNYQ